MKRGIGLVEISRPCVKRDGGRKAKFVSGVAKEFFIFNPDLLRILRRLATYRNGVSVALKCR